MPLPAFDITPLFGAAVQVGLFAAVGLLVRTVRELTREVTELRIDGAKLRLIVVGGDGMLGFDVRLRATETSVADHEGRIKVHDDDRDERRQRTRRAEDRADDRAAVLPSPHDA